MLTIIIKINVIIITNKITKITVDLLQQVSPFVISKFSHKMFPGSSTFAFNFGNFPMKYFY